MTDLYAVLGVPRDANAQTIRRAFRKKARSAHPDGGGSVEDFNQLKSAYDTLSDPARRRRYDETGEVGDPSADPHVAKIIELLSQAFDQALSEISSSGALNDADIIPLMAKSLAMSATQTSAQHIAFESRVAQMQRLKDRFSVIEGENLMETVITKRIKFCQQQIELLTDRLQLIREALAILERTRLEHIVQLDNKNNSESSKLFDFSSLLRFK
jgi:curved DNA-binding protein CbpA